MTSTELMEYGTVLYNRGHHARSAAMFERATRINARDVDAHFNLGLVRVHLEQMADAAASFERVIAVMPDHAPSYLMAAHAYGQLNQHEQCLKYFETGLNLQASFSGYYNLGQYLLRMGRNKDAETAFRAAIALKPDEPEPHLLLASTLLSRLKFAEGYEEFAWRKQMPDASKPESVPEWTGSNLNGKHLYVRFEQGNGDIIQNSRFLIPLAQQATKVSFLVPYELQRLFRHAFAHVPNIHVVKDAVQEYDEWMFLDTALEIFRPGISLTPNRPYIKPVDSDFWKQLFLLSSRLKVGVVWAGNPEGNRIDTRRSLHPDMLAPLLTIPDIQFFSLQIGDAAAQRPAHLFDAAPYIDDWYDTAGAVSALDLLITVDTGIAHLAGAMGKPVWMLSRFDSCWRWGQLRKTTPWYPSMGIYYQKQWGDWSYPIERMRGDLLTLVKQHG